VGRARGGIRKEACWKLVWGKIGVIVLAIGSMQREIRMSRHAVFYMCAIR
jgi:hypothetical protein